MKSLSQLRIRFTGIRFSLTTVLVGCFATLIAITVMTVLAIAVHANLRNTLSLLHGRAALQLTAMEDDLRIQLDAVTSTVKSLASRFQVEPIDEAEKSLHAYLTGALLATPIATSIVVVMNGVVNGVARMDGQVIENVGGPIPPNPSIQNLLKQRLISNATFWSDYTLVNDRIYTNVSTPLIRQGEKIGFIIASVSLRNLSDIAMELGQRFATTAFILDGDEDILAHPYLLSERLQSWGRGPTIPLDHFSDPVLAAYPMRQIFNSFIEEKRTPIEISNVDVEGKDYAIITKQITGYGPRIWTIGAYYPLANYMNELERIFYSILAGIIALIFAIFVSWWLGRRLSKPIRQIAKAATHISALDFDQVQFIPRNFIREIHDQAIAFNGMSHALRAFTNYVPRSLVKKLTASGGTEEINSRTQELTVMFTDIAGFTRLSEHLPAMETAALLNKHFEIICSKIMEEKGTIDKFLGDGVMAFWGAPDALEDHASAAIRAALSIQDAIIADNKQAKQENRPCTQLRIGVHSGSVVVGNIGAFDRVNYTIIGDTVNVAQRLQTLGKTVSPDREVTILASEKTVINMHSVVETTSVGDCPIPGRDGAVKVVRVEYYTKNP